MRKAHAIEGLGRFHPGGTHLDPAKDVRLATEVASSPGWGPGFEAREAADHRTEIETKHSSGPLPP
jgi:hypothetical protein